MTEKAVPRIVLVAGPESYLREQAIENAVARIRSVYPEAERVVVNLHLEESDADLWEACAPTLFGDAMVVEVSGIESPDDAGAEALLQVIAELPDHISLVLEHAGGVGGKKLQDAARKAGAEVVECKAIKKGRETTDLLVKRLSRKRRKMTPAALEVFYDAIGQNIPMLMNGLDQLMSDVEEDPIDVAHVRSYFSGVADVAGYEIANDVWNRKAVAALETLRQSIITNGLSGTGVMSVMAMASGLRAIVRMGALSPGISDADAARELGIPPFRVRDVRQQWQRWSGDQRRLARAVVQLADAEADMKGGRGGKSLDDFQKRYALEMMVTAVTARAAQ